MVFAIKLYKSIPDNVTYMGYRDEEQFIYNLSNDDVIVQQFTSPHDFEFMSLHLSDHDQIIEGKTYISVMDVATGEVISDKEYDNSSIHYGEKIRIAFPNGGTKDTLYEVSLSFSGMGDTGFGIFGFPVDSCSYEACSLDPNYSTAVGTHSYTNVYKILVILAMMTICFIVVWAIYLFTRNEWSWERRFLGLVIPMGAFFLLFFSVNSVHDGNTHLATSYHYSNLLMFSESREYPSQMQLYEDEVPNIALSSNTDSKCDYHIEDTRLKQYYDFISDFGRIRKNSTKIETSDYTVTSNSSIVEYLPAILGITITRILHLGSYIGLLVGKMCMFAFYVVCCYWAIRIVPTHKMLLTVVSLIPMNLYQATGITYDAMVTPICIFLTALFIKANIQVLSKIEIVFIYIICLVLGLSKGSVYLLIPLIFFFMPKKINEESTGKRKILIGGIISGFLGIIPCFIKIYSKYLFGAFIQIDTYTSIIKEDPTTGNMVESYTFTTMINNPVETCRIIIKTFFNSIEKMIGQAFGNRMSWTDSETNWIIIVMLIIVLVMSVCKSSDEPQLKIGSGTKFFIILLAGAELLTLSLIMLIADFVPIGTENLKGVQGRYFLPWAALLTLVLSNNRIFIDDRGKRYIMYFEAIALASYAMSFLMIFMGV